MISPDEPAVLARAAHRLRAGWPLVLEGTIAATAAWLLATQVIGHAVPFFAPAAALIVLGQARGQRIVRMVEVLLGVAAGVLVADIVATLLGPGTTLTIVVVIVLMLMIVTAAGGGPLLLVQGAVSAIYVAVIAPPTITWVPLRFIDALTGGLVALLVMAVARPGDPVRPLTVRTREVLHDVADVVDSTAAALVDGDTALVRAELARARTKDAEVESLRGEVAATREALWVHRGRRRRLPRVEIAETALGQVDYVVRNIRVLVRSAVSLSTLDAPVPPQVPAALRSLAVAIRAVSQSLAADLAGDRVAAVGQTEAAGDAVRVAVATAGQLLVDRQPLPVVMIAGLVRSCGIDLLRAAGVEATDSLIQVDRAMGMPPA